MKKQEIFEDVIKIMHEDSASCKDTQGADPTPYIEQISEDMDDNDFVRLVSSYLSGFGLTGHLSFRKKGMFGIHFKVRRYGDTLYVVDVYGEDEPMHIGDKIIKIDGMSVEEFYNANAEFFYNQPEERQTPHWTNVLKYAKLLTCLDKAGKEYTYEIDVSDYKDAEDDRKYYYKQINNEVSYIYLADFDNEPAIVKMYNQNKEKMDNSRYLIIDVRGNSGGSDSAFFPLIRYCLPEGVACKDVKLKSNKFSECGMEINFSEKNCAIRKQSIEEYVSQDIPEESKAMLNNMIEELDRNCGKGFITVSEDDGGDSIDLPYTGDTKIERVFVITDEDCGSSGDNCVLVLGAFPKVTVVGRPTMGIMDYSNVAFENYGDFRLMYPTSRLTYIDKGIHMMAEGVPVDEYIPWTPEHLERDVDVEYILNNLI